MGAKFLAARDGGSTGTAVKKLCKEGRIPHIGMRQVSDPTDTEYVDKTISRMKQDYLDCPEEWRHVFLAGLCKRDYDALMELL